MASGRLPDIPDKYFFKIGEVARLAGVEPYVLRYWESEFPWLAPEKNKKNQRVYGRNEVVLVLFIKHLLHGYRYTIEGARKIVEGLKGDWAAGFAMRFDRPEAAVEAVPDSGLAEELTRARQSLDQAERKCAAMEREKKGMLLLLKELALEIESLKKMADEAARPRSGPFIGQGS